MPRFALELGHAVALGGPPDPPGMVLAALGGVGAFASMSAMDAPETLAGSVGVLVALAILVRELRLFFQQPPSNGR